MKKVLLASAVALSILGYTQTTAQAQENKAESVRENVTIPHSSTSKIENQEKSKEKVEKTDNSSKIDDKEEKTEKKTPATEEKKSEVKKEEKVEKVKEGWQEENNNWRFYEHNKPVTNWKKIQGKWYYFNKDGHRLSNTTFDGYVFNKDGVMAENGWNFINGKWYFAKSSGKISQEKWEKVNGSWYYFDKKGIMLSSTTFKGYLFNNSGAMAENSWVKIKDTWFYANASGKFVQNKWEKISGSWYSFAQDGAMLADKWSGSYYLKTNGAMADNEWIFDKNYNSWFFLKRGGMYASKEWIGAYYLKAGGYMAKKEWIYDDTYKARYYLDDNGHYVSGTYKIDGRDHLFHKNGQWISEVSKEVGFVKGQYSRTIFLDPGHGGRDSGAYYYNVAEKDLNMQVYRKLRKKLEELGYKVLTSRDSDIDVDFVTERSRMVNKTNSDIFISIHFNATGNAYSKSSGIQTYSYSDDPDYPSKINPYWHNHPDRMSESKRLAAAIHSSLLAETGAKDAGLLERSFAVLRETAKPAVLLELGYIDNFAENQQIRDSHYQDKLVAGIVKGIQKYYAGK